MLDMQRKISLLFNRRGMEEQP